MKRLFFFLFILLGYAISLTPSVLAFTTPEFPSCNNPTGVVQASYDSGVHGIVGDMSTYTGKDTVYALDNGNFLQCFEGQNGKGIQTDWMKVGDLSQVDIEVLEQEGWIYVPNGSLWGLEDCAYLAKNVSYSCTSLTTTPTVTPTSTPSSSSSGSSNSSSSGGSSNPVQNVLSAAASTASNFANTGTALLITGLFMLATGLLIIATSLRKLLR